MTGQEKEYIINKISITQDELKFLMCFDTACFNSENENNGYGFVKTSYLLEELIRCFGYGTQYGTQDGMLRILGKRLLNNGIGKSDNIKRIYPGHGVYLKHEFIDDFGTGKKNRTYKEEDIADEMEKYKNTTWLSRLKNMKLEPKNKAQAPTPEPAPAPIPQDIQGDIHLMAMTILEKLQPVLLNAIYTELMEHQK